jgi:signal transduction histidine kinase
VPLSATSHSALNAYQEEKIRRLALVLHDELGQNLAILKLKLSEILKPGSGSREEIIGLLDETMNKVRQVVFDMRPIGLEEFGLVSALQSHVLEFRKRTGMNCELKITPSNIDVSTQMSMAVFRIVQEALTNALKHSRANLARISITQSAQKLSIEIIDNGCGITLDQIQSTKTLGISSMKSRVTQLNGQFEISGKPGEGTRIGIVFPMMKANLGGLL